MFYDRYGDKNMPRKTLALISGLVLVTVILFVIALRSTKPETQQTPPSQQTTQQQPSPTSAAHSLLMLSPNPVTVQPGQKGTVDVTIDTSDNAVTAIQLEIAYDPTLIGTLQVVPSSLFPNPVVLINKNDVQAGRMTYAFGIAPNQPTVQGKGSVATITFTAKGSQGKQTQLTLLPTTLVTARGVASSVLKEASGTIVNIGGAATSNGAMTPQSSTQTAPAQGY